MLHAPTEKHNPKRGGRQRRFPIALRAAAAELGCNHSHLYRVLVGQRESRSLYHRYQELLAKSKQWPAIEPTKIYDTRNP